MRKVVSLFMELNRRVEKKKVRNKFCLMSVPGFAKRFQLWYRKRDRRLQMLIKAKIDTLKVVSCNPRTFRFPFEKTLLLLGEIC